jgi:RNA polymerase sigma-70 factor (ECF subfamily)
MSDEDLMSQFQMGTVEAFNLLVERYEDRLKHFLYGFLKDGRRSEDLTQETFLRVYRNRHAYTRIASFSTWIHTIAGNLARSEYRKRKRRKTYSLYGQGSDGDEYERPLPDLRYAADRDAERSTQRTRIRQALNQLTPAFREVVVLRDVQHLRYDEIAELTGLPLGTVKSRINRGRKKLQAMLEDVYSGVEDE